MSKFTIKFSECSHKRWDRLDTWQWCDDCGGEVRWEADWDADGRGPDIAVWEPTDECLPEDEEGNEFLTDLLIDAGAAIAYWATAQWSGGDMLTVREWEASDDEAAHAVITPDALRAWLSSPAAAELAAAMGDPYQRQAMADLIACRYDDADYDAITGDLIIQSMTFGEVVYS